MLEIVQTAAAPPEEIMAKDAALLQEASDQVHPILHLYEWRGSAATYGYFIDPFQHLAQEGVERVGLQLARRPTGGGIIFHLCDLAFSCLIPARHPWYSTHTLHNYSRINGVVIKAISSYCREHSPALLEQAPIPLDAHSMHFCMAQPTKYDIILEGRKVGGAAQRRTKEGLLHQGSIVLANLPSDYLATLLKPGTRVQEAMAHHSYPLLPPEWTAADLQQARQQLSLALKEAFAAAL